MQKLGKGHAVLIFANILLFVFTASRFAFFRQAAVDETPLDYGTEIDDAAFEILQAQGGLSGSRTHALVLFLSVDDPRTSEALAWLSRSRSTTLRKLAIAVVIDRENTDLHYQMRRTSHVHTIFDPDHTLHRYLRIAPNHKHGGTVVIRRDGRVDFSATSVLPSDEIRQMVEKYEFGEIRYAAIESPVMRLIRLGGVIPDLPGRRLSDGEHTRLSVEDTANAAVVIFGTVCPSCDLRGLLLDLDAFSSTLQGKRSLLLLFVGFDQATLSSALSGHLAWKRQASLWNRSIY